ncbi:MAG: SDR family oxidoreductase [Candidatus Aenigmatarchaeota archaeon]
MKTVLVSGGTWGIGKGAVIQLLKDGFNVSAFSRDHKKCDTFKKELERDYDKERFLIMDGDVTDEENLHTIINETLKKFKKIDILFNNAGFGYFEDCDKVDIDRFQEMVQTNIIGLSLLTKLIVPHMKKQKSGLIINMASISGKRAFANGEFYSATKFAVMGYSEAIRNELKPFGIKVFTICPGMVETAFFTEEELARRRKTLGIKNIVRLRVEDINRIISLVCNQSEHCDIQDLTVMPF